MKKEVKRTALIYMAAALAVILFFGFYLIRSDFIASDPMVQMPQGSTELYDGYSFTISPTSRRVDGILFSPLSGSPEGLVLEIRDGDAVLGRLEPSAADEGLFFENTEGTVLERGRTYCLTAVWQKDGNLTVAGSADEPWHVIYYRWIGRDALRSAFILSAAAMAALLYYLSSVRGISPETVFLIVSVPLCTAFAVVIPALRAPDEVVHFLRAFGIVRGVWIVPSDGMVHLPSNIVPEGFSAPYSEVFSFYSMIKGGDIILSGSNAAFNIRNAALYNPLVYVFSCIGIAAADLFSDSFYVLLCAGRLAGALGCTLMIYLAIRMIPKGKELLCLISLFPINLQERASISADGPTYAAAVLLTAFVLYMRLSGEKMDRRRTLQLYAILIFTAACKVVYFAMAVLVLLIPAECFDSKKKALTHRILGIGGTTALSLSWVALASRYLGETQGGGHGIFKIVYALTHPLWYIKLMGMTCAERLAGWALQTIAPPMGYFDIPVSKLFAALMGACALALTFREAVLLKRSGQKRDRFVSLVLLGTSFIVLMLIFASLYVQWTEGTPPAISSIEGIQGRYFLPFLPAAFLGIAGIPARGTQKSLPLKKETYPAACLTAVADIMVIANIFISCSL